MAHTLHLKNRPGKNQIIIPLQQITDIVKSEAKDDLFNVFKALTEDDIINDKHWLEFIVNWLPEGGLALCEQAKWFKLAKRVAELDDKKEGDFTISDFQATTIWNRLKDPKFILKGRMDSALVEFIMEFQEITGHHFDGEDPDKE
jgi:hypothetical protein